MDRPDFRFVPVEAVGADHHFPHHYLARPDLRPCPAVEAVVHPCRPARDRLDLHPFLGEAVAAAGRCHRRARYPDPAPMEPSRVRWFDDVGDSRALNPGLAPAEDMAGSSLEAADPVVAGSARIVLWKSPPKRCRAEKRRLRLIFAASSFILPVACPLEAFIPTMMRAANW